MSVRVNGEEISAAAIQYELDRLVRFYSEHMSAEQIREQMDLLKEKATEQAVGARLLIAEAARLDIRVAKDHVEESLRRMRQNAGGEEGFQALLERQNLTEDMVRGSIERGRRVDILVGRITEGIADPTEAEIKAHFEEHSAEYRLPDRAEAQHILIKPDSDGEQDRETAKSKLLEIRRKIEEGADFADQAAIHSHCPSGKKAGGSLGWVSRRMTVPELDEALFAMAVGELSDIIETRLGHHLVKKTGEKKGGQADYDEVRDKIRDFLRHVRRGEVIAAHVAELKKKAVIEEE